MYKAFFIEGNTRRSKELPTRCKTAKVTKGVNIITFRIEDINAVVENITRIQIPSIRVESYGCWLVELSRSTASAANSFDVVTLLIEYIDAVNITTLAI